jgi:hypothetical protein
MAVQPKAPDTNAGPNITPAPHKAAPTVVTSRDGWPHPKRGSGYGNNQSTVSPSLHPGERVGSDLDTAPPDGDSKIEHILACGSRCDATTLDKVAAGNVPINPGARGRG